VLQEFVSAAAAAAAAPVWCCACAGVQQQLVASVMLQEVCCWLWSLQVACYKQQVLQLSHCELLLYSELHNRKTPTTRRHILHWFQLLPEPSVKTKVWKLEGGHAYRQQSASLQV
jgi:hypothetical protein